MTEHAKPHPNHVPPQVPGMKAPAPTITKEYKQIKKEG